MVPTGSLGLWLQDAVPASSGNNTLMIVFVGLVALAMVMQNDLDRFKDLVENARERG